ncbi:MAG: hypothetical protein JNM71_05175 [Flavobacterium lindanitolerans]|uniref:hypothetical protein n=1 Tax=Flavobacterium lindanitolerans TaxID=428988 RepID=UPI001A519BB8|nr:hypothetical protein [Flavobacterium lindanitolerans]MBL7867390.1 hypothetical protein [Flavobacterium lindanitolerans]
MTGQGITETIPVTNYYFPLPASQPFTRPTKITAGLVIQASVLIPLLINPNLKRN